MAKKLIIAEKPSLAKNIVIAIGKMDRMIDTISHGIYFENENYIVTNAYGHLLELQDADWYNPEYKIWDIDHLPIIPSEFVYKIKNDAGVKAQFLLIKRLASRQNVDALINAGDSDREGEIIIRNILNEIGNTKPVYRLWMPDQTPETIQAELQGMKLDSIYDNLANEGYARTFIDWMYGINLTRLVTKKVNRLMRVGRVTSPIVTAICERERAIRNFKPQKYYVASHNENGLHLISKNKFDDESDCAKLCGEYNQTDTYVKDKQTSRKNIPRPVLFSLSDLQGVAGKKMGFSPKKALDVLQTLYEDGYVSYPRTNSQYMAVAEKEKAKSVIEAIKNAFPKEGFGISFRDSETIFDDSKVESHSGITPTYQIPDVSKLSPDAADLYALVLKRFMAVFCTEEFSVDRTTIVVTNEIEDFTLSGDIIITKGFTVYEKTSIQDTVLPLLNPGDKIIPMFRPKEKETTPPDHYTADSLNAYLKNPYSKTEKKTLSTDMENKAIIGEVELGTEATRAGLIDNAIKSGYITLERNQYGITDLGEYYTDTLEQLGVDMTKERTLNLSKSLKRVFKGELTVAIAVEDAKRDLCDICSQSKAVSVVNSPSCSNTEHVKSFATDVFCKCPKCGSEIVKTNKAYCCSNKDCSVVIFKNDYFFERFQKKMTDGIAKSLFTRGYALVDGLISQKTGNPFSARVNVDFTEKYPKYHFEFDDTKKSQ